MQRLLGEGGFGRVYLAVDEQLQRSVAIKVPHRHRMTNPQDLADYLAEARIVAGLEHPHIVPVYDVGQTEDGRCFVVSKHIPGTTLAEHWKHERPSLREGVRVLSQVAEALHFAHTRGFVHRDVKPANILIDEKGCPFVADFGLALHESDQPRRAGEVSGSPAYMSPEQVRGMTHHLDGRADVWALGVMLYELLTGRCPFAGATFEELFDEIERREPRPPSMIVPDVPPLLERLCLTALSKQVAARTVTAKEFADELRAASPEAFASDRGNENRSASGRAPPSGRQLRRIGYGILGCAAVGCGVVLAIELQRRPASDRGTNGEAQLDRRRDDDEPPSAGDRRRVARPLSTANLDVRLWTPGDPARRGLSLSDPGALPLRRGDQIRIEASVDEPAYLYLVWIDTEGAARPVYPWKPGDWSRRPTIEQPVESLSLPESQDLGWPLAGPAGMETLVMLARRKPLPSDAMLRESFAGLPPQAAQQSRSLAWFADGSLSTAQTRAPQFFDPQRIEDPVVMSQRVLSERLARLCDGLVAISFANSGAR